MADEAEAMISAALEKGDIEEARRHLATARQVKEALLRKQPLAIAEVLEGLAARFSSATLDSREAGDVADGLLRDALTARERFPGEEQASLAGCLTALSDLDYKRGRWKESEDYERRSLEIRERVLGPVDPAVAENLRGLAILLYEQGRVREAEPFADRARQILERAGPPDTPDLVEVLNVQAEILRVLNRLAESEGRFGEALGRAARLEPEDDALTAEVLSNLAGLLKDQGRYAEAEAAYRTVVTVFKGGEGADPFDFSTSLLNQAEIFRLQGRMAEAGPLYARALETARRLLGPGDPQLVSFLSQSGVFHTEEGRYDLAEPLYREALDLLASSLDADHPLVAQSLHDLAALLRSTRRFAEAEAAYRRALAIREKSLGEGHPEVGATLTQLARTLFSIGSERDSEALETVDRAVRILSATPAYPEMRAEALAVRAELLRRRGDLSGAISTMDGALRVVEEVRPRIGGTESSRAEFLTRYVRLFDLMVEWQVEGGDLQGAVQYAERRRGRVLLDQLAAARVDLRSSIPGEVLAPLAKREAEAGALLAEHQKTIASLSHREDLSPEGQRALRENLERELDVAAREYQDAAAAIQEASPLWREVLTAGGTTVSAATIQRELVPPKGLILLYQIGRDRSFVFAVPPAPLPIESVELRIDPGDSAALGIPPGPLGSNALDTALGGDGADARGATRGLDKVPAAGQGSERAGEARLQALWRTLVPGDLWPRVRRAAEVIIVPDGPLYRLPFEALVVLPAGSKRDVRYWLDDGPVIHYASSATSLYSLGREPGGQTSSSLIVANPTLDPAASPSGLSALPGTAREAEAIRDVLVAGHVESVRVLEGEAAEERAVRKALEGGSRYLHFATHGIVDQRRNELLAALVLTPAASGPRTLDNDGLLQLFEIYGLKLRASLAVLSACESAVGRRLEGEGVFALSRGFLAAGARRVIASQWPVDDASTAVLMADFYRRITEAEVAGARVDYATSLRDARLTLRRRPAWSAPYFWAPFVLTGTR